MPNYFRTPDALVDAVRAVLSGKQTETQEDIIRKADVKMVKVKLPDGRIVMRRDRPEIKVGNEEIDPVNPKALKKMFKDRKDKDIDNDGDVDSSDKYLHKRRKAISKAMKEGVVLDEAQKLFMFKTKQEADKKAKEIKGKVIELGPKNFAVVTKDLTVIPEDTDDNPANRQHLCAKNVVHENWGEGVCIPTMHADPDAEGNVGWYDIMFEHGIETRVSIEELKVTKAESHMHSSKKKIKENDDYDDDDDDEDNDKKKKKMNGKKDEIDLEPKLDDQKMTSEMSDVQMKKREEIVKSMKKKMSDFKKRYGDRAKDVMYATATKMAMKEGFELTEEDFAELDEAKMYAIGYHFLHGLKNQNMKKSKDFKTKKEAEKAANDIVRAKGGRAEVYANMFDPSGRPGHQDYPKLLKTIKEEVELDEALKYEGKFKVGDVVRAYDFKPMKDRKNVYVQGKIVKAGTMVQGAKVYEVKIENDSGKTSGRRIGDIAYVPMQVSMFEYDGRIVKVSDIKEGVELDEGRGRPRKDGTTGGSEDRENIQMQLRKSVSLRGLKDVEFDDGKKVKVPAKVAQGVMSKINSIKDAKQKQNAVQHIAKSHKHMMDFHKGDYKDADAKRQDILKLK